MAYKKKLHLANPEKKLKEIEIYHTKRETKVCKSTPKNIELGVRELLSKKVSGTLLGLWLLMPEHLRLGTWDLLKGWTKKGDNDIEPRLALQMVHEACMCVKGIRQSRSLCHQGFELSNGLPYIATDKQIHNLLDSHTSAQAKELQIVLGKIRKQKGDYARKVFAIDPHRVATYSQRVMPKKKKNSKSPSQKVVQYFFCIDTHTGQPIAFTIGSSGKTVTKASLELVEIVKAIIPSKVLLLGDTEHYTTSFIDYLYNKSPFDLLIPAPNKKRINNLLPKLQYERVWAGYAIAETTYKMDGASYPFRLIAQRSGENSSQYTYKSFITKGNGTTIDLLTEQFPKRWSIEEFFNFETTLGWNKVNTLNLNVIYGKLSLTLIAQAAIYQLRKKLPKPYKNWTAEHMANSLFHGIDGDIRVRDDTIIVTMYNLPEKLNIKKHYEHLPEKLEKEGVNPKIPWLYNFKLDFKFK